MRRVKFACGPPSSRSPARRLAAADRCRWRRSRRAWRGRRGRCGPVSSVPASVPSIEAAPSAAPDRSRRVHDGRIRYLAGGRRGAGRAKEFVAAERAARQALARRQLAVRRATRDLDLAAGHRRYEREEKQADELREKSHLYSAASSGSTITRVRPVGLMKSILLLSVAKCLRTTASDVAQTNVFVPSLNAIP